MKLVSEYKSVHTQFKRWIYDSLQDDGNGAREHISFYENEGSDIVQFYIN